MPRDRGMARVVKVGRLWGWMCLIVLAGMGCGSATSSSARAAGGDTPEGNPPLGLVASLFATNPAGPVNNVSLAWASAEPCDRFEIQRATREAGPYKTISVGTGLSYNDYALAERAYFYRIVAYQGQRKLISHVQRIATMPMPSGLQTYSNQTDKNASGLPGKPLKVGETYYDFRIGPDGKGVKVVQWTSQDGQNWKEGPVVMDASSHPDLAECKFEAIDTFYDPINHQIVWWCHWELPGGHYEHGRAVVATAKPGERFKVHHVYNPLGIQVRDMSVFIDDDHQGYLVTAANVPGQGANATLYIFKLNKTYDDAVEVVAKVLEDGYREAPHIVKQGDFYYLFFSQAAGWFPSRGGYVSAKSLSGPWSPARSIGNPSTFSSQSGAVIEYGSGESHVPVMMGNRWVRGEGSNGNVALPVQMADGFAFYDYAPVLLHDPAMGLIVPLHMGRLLSQGKPAQSSIPGNPGHEAEKAFDGDYDSCFQSDTKTWPFDLTSDLGVLCTIRNVQISWFMHKGSEAYYTYTIEGSRDGKRWVTLIDRTDTNDTMVSKTYGFTSDVPAQTPPVRYVRLTVRAAHLHNNPGNWYPPTLYEVKVFGEPAGRK